MKTVAIIDYGMCNIDSVARAMEKLGAEPLVTSRPDQVMAADGIILPGVGSFNDAMVELRQRQLIEPLQQQVKVNHTPFLGICLGMQLMASSGEEGGHSKGLDLIPGQIIRLQAEAGERIPHVGWNEVHQQDADSPLFAELTDKRDFYFVHSFHFVCASSNSILATTPYCGGFTSAVGHGNCFGVQFHPEKSLRAGATLLTNFLALC